MGGLCRNFSCYQYDRLNFPLPFKNTWRIYWILENLLMACQCTNINIVSLYHADAMITSSTFLYVILREGKVSNVCFLGKFQERATGSLSLFIFYLSSFLFFLNALRFPCNHLPFASAWHQFHLRLPYQATYIQINTTSDESVVTNF